MPDYWQCVDLLAAAQFEARGLKAEVIPQEGSHLVLFRFERTPTFDLVAADLDRGIPLEDPGAVERARRALRTRAILANATKRGPA
jgi:hypothetical protein